MHQCEVGMCNIEVRTWTYEKRAEIAEKAYIIITLLSVSRPMLQVGKAGAITLTTSTWACPRPSSKWLRRENGRWVDETHLWTEKASKEL